MGERVIDRDHPRLIILVPFRLLKREQEKKLACFFQCPSGFKIGMSGRPCLFGWRKHGGLGKGFVG